MPSACDATSVASLLDLSSFRTNTFERLPHVWSRDNASFYESALGLPKELVTDVDKWVPAIRTVAPQSGGKAGGPPISAYDLLLVQRSEMLGMHPNEQVPEDLLRQRLEKRQDTLVVHWLNHRLGSLWALTAAFADTFGMRTQANLYHSPADGAVGLDRHYDIHDAFIHRRETHKFCSRHVARLRRRVSKNTGELARVDKVRAVDGDGLSYTSRARP